MAHARRFDHDEAYARWQAGETFAQLALAYGVTTQAIRYLVKMRQPGGRDEINTYQREYQRRVRRKPCVRGCGRLAWSGPGRTGICNACARADQTAAAEAQENHGTETRYCFGCRCVQCTAAARDAKRRRREAAKVPCSHGCGTMVHGINRDYPDKPPECQRCAMKRIGRERRAA